MTTNRKRILEAIGVVILSGYCLLWIAVGFVGVRSLWVYDRYWGDPITGDKYRYGITSRDGVLIVEIEPDPNIIDPSRTERNWRWISVRHDSPDAVWFRWKQEHQTDLPWYGVSTYRYDTSVSYLLIEILLAIPLVLFGVIFVRRRMRNRSNMRGFEVVLDDPEQPK